MLFNIPYFVLIVMLLSMDVCVRDFGLVLYVLLHYCKDNGGIFGPFIYMSSHKTTMKTKYLK